MASDRHDHQAEAWFGSYLFVGFAQNGLAPILLPLASNGGTGSGLSYASFALTGLAAPILGSWADRTSRHRDLLVWGCFRAAACFLAMCLTSGGPAVIVWAGGAGLGVTAATTAANVLVIQGVDERLWDGRVANLQRIVSTGQVFGLLLARDWPQPTCDSRFFARQWRSSSPPFWPHSRRHARRCRKLPLGRYRGRSSAARRGFPAPAQCPSFRPRRASRIPWRHHATVCSVSRGVADLVHGDERSGGAFSSRHNAPIRHASHPASECLRGGGGSKPPALQKSEHASQATLAGGALDDFTDMCA